MTYFLTVSQPRGLSLSLSRHTTTRTIKSLIVVLTTINLLFVHLRLPFMMARDRLVQRLTQIIKVSKETTRMDGTRTKTLMVRHRRNEGHHSSRVDIPRRAISMM